MENLDKKYLAFVLDNKSRDKLISAFPPSFDKTICHHVTIKFNNVSEEDVEKYSTRWEIINSIDFNLQLEIED